MANANDLPSLVLGAKWKLLSELRSRREGNGAGFIKEDEVMLEKLPAELNTYVQQDLERQLREWDKAASRATHVEKITDKGQEIATRLEQVSPGSEMAKVMLQLVETLRRTEFNRIELESLNATFFNVMQTITKQHPDLLSEVFQAEAKRK